MFGFRKLKKIKEEKKCLHVREGFLKNVISSPFKEKKILLQIVFALAEIFIRS